MSEGSDIAIAVAVTSVVTLGVVFLVVRPRLAPAAEHQVRRSLNRVIDNLQRDPQYGLAVSVARPLINEQINRELPIAAREYVAEVFGA